MLFLNSIQQDFRIGLSDKDTLFPAKNWNKSFSFLASTALNFYEIKNFNAQVIGNIITFILLKQMLCF